MDIKKHVSIVKKKTKTDDVFELVDYFNINVIETDLGSATLGMYRYIKRNKFIFLNNDLEHYQKKIRLSARIRTRDIT